ncbi:Transcriptional regulator [Luteimonas sp. 9C]|uniref:metalloregulator ArsR/SmtB family transcription factor n=1 Tax=Luteimonas sp. 9C TaxID=2653148 RepID=UPI0012F0E3E1|nr:metalloregulator ArsR/SmtB family transcription factor [Luteimonas sp. 9C]VXB64844.1 Transcriptional regulator [Luteimonas sp. 9C]
MERVFEALASTPRRQILAYLNAGELTAGEIGARFEFSKPALSGHLRVLEQAGLIEREKRGQFVFFRLVPDRLANTLFAWAAEVCPVGGPIKRERRKPGRA